jgi:PAS domain S-box-containing protein
MLRYKLIRNLLLLSLALAIALPAYEFLFVHPAYQQLITSETEKEAVRYASYMVRTLGLENRIFTQATLPDNLLDRLRPVSRDTQLIKLRIFSASGEIIFSTKPEEVGTINTRDYFRETVAEGQVYSKVVRKDSQTAEGDTTQVDIVETYVPFLADDVFGGAFEVYYDVTQSVDQVRTLSIRSHLAIVLMSCGFLVAIFIALYRAHASFRERDAAELALQQAYEDLEQKVVERTRELQNANTLLTEQINERVQTQQALAAALEDIRVDREKLSAILRSVPDGVIVADNRLQVLHINAAAETILETSMEQVLGASIATLSRHVDFGKEVAERLNRDDVPQPFDIELPCGTHETCVYQVRLSQFMPETAAPSGIVMLIRDVTREREIEQMKSAFLGMAAHELNTPLTTIIGYTELLTGAETAREFTSAQIDEFLQMIHAKALALGRLVDDLLDISRVESGRPLPLNYHQFDLNRKAREVVSRFEAKTREHTFDVVLPSGEASICADRERIDQVLDHLICNAVKYSPGGGRISVFLKRQDKGYRIVVGDEGIGMNKEEVAHLFDRFYRADSSDTAVPGVGLGMSLVRHIVRAHNGEIQVSSQPGRGTKVTIILPEVPVANSSGPAVSTD